MAKKQPPVVSGGYAFPHEFAWKWTFCEERTRLGGVSKDHVQLAEWATLLYEVHSERDPREVARDESQG